MVPAWIRQQTGTMITLGSPAAVRSQYQARDSGYLTLCSACSGYADFRHPLHAEQRINVHPSYSLSIHQRRRQWQGHDACCAVAYRQQMSYSFQPLFASKRPFHHLDQKLEHLQHWKGRMICVELKATGNTVHKFLPSALLQRTFTLHKSDHKIKPTISVLPKLLSSISQYVKKKLLVNTRHIFF